MARNVLAVGAIAVLLVGTVGITKLHAQGPAGASRTIGSSGMNSQLGSSTTSGLGQRSLGSSGLTGGGQSSTGLGGGIGLGGSLGASGFGQSAFGGQAGVGGLGGGYGALMQSGYAGTQGGAGMGTGQQFGQAGMGQTGQFGRTTTTGQVGTTQQGRTGQTNRATGAGQRQMTGTGQGTSQNTQPPVPVRLELAFTAPRPSMATVATNIQANLNNVLANRNFGQVQTSMDNGVVVLTGRTGTESQRTVLESLVMIQPGVSAVRNEIVVGPPEDSGDRPQ
jgi:osmotically-inducible protein OsmY